MCTMELSSIILVVAWSILSSVSVEGLIGLRPPNQTPYYDDDNPKRITSPQPSRIHRTQLHNPYETLSHSHNYPVNETSLVFGKAQSSDGCNTKTLYQCSYGFLRHAIRNDTDTCVYVQDFIRCALTRLRTIGRRSFVVGLTTLQSFNNDVKSSHRCHSNQTMTDVSRSRHRRAKRNEDPCCVEHTLDCAIQTFWKMVTQPNRCPLVEYYSMCINDKVCRASSSVARTSPDLQVTLLKQLCQNDRSTI